VDGDPGIDNPTMGRVGITLRSAFDRTHPDLYLDTRAETVENRNKPVSRETSEIRVANAGESAAAMPVRTRAARTVRRSRSIERFDDFGGKNRLKLLGIRIVPADIPEHIVAATNNLPFLLLVSFQHLLQGLQPVLDSRITGLGFLARGKLCGR
jgi:hypothetical protein